MGAGASQSFFEKDETGLEVPDAPDNIKALAGRLSKAHGINEAILVHGLVRTSRGPHTMCDPPGVSVTHGVLWGCSHEAVQHLQRPRASRVL